MIAAHLVPRLRYHASRCGAAGQLELRVLLEEAADALAGGPLAGDAAPGTPAPPARTLLFALADARGHRHRNADGSVWEGSVDQAIALRSLLSGCRGLHEGWQLVSAL